ncbi:MAG: plasmid pRiA4b ORF-3 family protein [Deltaproteobacteria bacterium]|nr:plasmid pRiA4b ORF-3 family protein [Deltaproteobacteria bacterium]
MKQKAAEKTGRTTWKPAPKDRRLFILEVCIISGPMTEKFIKRNKVVSRSIQIRDDQTLEDLHHAIFDAFDREEEHMYEFQVGGKRPMDPKARRYVLPMALDDPFADKTPAGDVTRTTIGSLGLKKSDAFGYWFDFGDDWWHQINVAGIEDKVPPGKYPKVTKRVGESPPQYVDWEEEDGAG